MSYSTLNFPGAIPGSKTFLTGIRRNKKTSIITGFYEVDGKNVSFIKANEGYYIIKYYNNVTNFRGPCILKHKKYRFVGNIITGLGQYVGCYYTGKLDGKGEWMFLARAKNTICYSTMGDLIVGNGQEDMTSYVTSAFIFDISENSFIGIEKEGARSISANGIWQNKRDNKECQHKYTICGSYTPMVGIHTSIGYTVDYNSKTKKFSNWRDYYYNDDAILSTMTQFNGITEGKHGQYNLTGTALYNGVEVTFLLSTHKKKSCHVPHVVIPTRKEEAEHCNVWYEVKYPGSNITTGNSIVENTVVGTYTVEDDDTVNGYITEIHLP